MKLRDALGIRRGEVVAFVGAGGKTSALFRLGHELAAEGWRVLATTTTRMAAEELRMASSTLALGANGHDATVRDVWRQLNRYGFVLTYNRVSRGKVIGLAPNAVEWLIDRVNSDALLIEADGARRLPFKAPQPHEPVVPDGTTLMVPVAGRGCDRAAARRGTRLQPRTAQRDLRLRVGRAGVCGVGGAGAAA
ncbi:MAG: selenium cofactor biosynthesis protein YqeC [Anaerolineae bacterium]|nr:selenium cofactor biosynthesis protein YqeC [Anaerolineae bacterium]